MFCLVWMISGLNTTIERIILHLENALQPQYIAKIDWRGDNFLGFTPAWNCTTGHVTLSMPEYIKNDLKKLQYIKEVFPQYSPHKHHAMNWTKKGDTQYARQENTSRFLSPKETLDVCRIK